MDMNNPVIVAVFTVLFIVLFLVPVYNIFKKPNHKSIFLSIYIFSLVFTARFSVALLADIEDIQDLNLIERFFDSIMHSVQTFSMDEDYTLYTTKGKELFENAGYSSWAFVYGLVISFLNIIAPILGGAMLVSIMTNLFPSFKIWRHPFKHKFVFSELNEQSICLAEDILRNENFKIILSSRNIKSKPLIIFTDAYVDDESESHSEILSRAKKIGAICIRDDLLNKRLLFSKSVTYLLIDEKTTNNIVSFSALMDNKYLVSESKKAKKSNSIKSCICNSGLWKFLYKRRWFYSLVNGGKLLWPEPMKNDRILKKFKVEILIDPECNLDVSRENFKKGNIQIELNAIDMQGKKIYVDKKEPDNQPITLNKYSKYITDYKYSEKNNVKKITVSFKFSKRPLDNSIPLELKSIFVNYQEPDPDTSELKDVVGKATIKTVMFSNKVENYLRTSIYVFIQEDREADIIGKIKDNHSNSDKVVLRTIRDYRNAAINLMNDVPLFLPLLYKDEDKKKDLYITILGSGSIARDVFKAIYWCGQMYETKLHVNIISKNAADMESKMKEEYPEMMECCNPNSSKLIVFNYKKNMERNSPYISTLHFTPIEDAKKVSDYPTGVLENTDYYIIALGSDEENASMTTILSDKLARMRLSCLCPETIFIVPAIFNPSLAKAITITKSDVKKEENNKTPLPNVQKKVNYIIPFSTFEERFSCKNIFMTDFTETALSIEKIYNRAHQLEMQNDEYTYWSNLVKAIHAPYKIYGFGMLEAVGDDLSGDKYRIKEDATFEKIPDQEQAWLEHRRWNAFLRSEGFSCPTDTEFKAYYKLIGSHKNIPLKLQRCLVESYIYKTHDLPDNENFDKSLYDCLDYASMAIYREKQIYKGKTDFYGENLRKSEYKQWDYKKEDPSLKALFDKKQSEIRYNLAYIN